METKRSIARVLEPIQKLDFFVRSIGKFQLVPPDREKKRQAVFSEIFWCVEGRGIFCLNGREYILRPDYVWYYPPGSLHDFTPANEGFSYYWLTINGRNAAALFDGLKISPGLNYAGSCPTHLFDMVTHHLRQNGQRSALEALSVAFQILTLVTSGQYQQVSQNELSLKALNIIDSNYSDPELNIEQVATILEVHRGSLSRSFTRSYGISISRYLQNKRLSQAMKLLKETNFPIWEVAKKSGFNSIEYFTQTFSKSLGVPPASFRSREELH